MTRQEANKKLLKELEWFIEICPDQRFGQILCNYFFPKYQMTDPFFVEPTDTLTEVDRVKKCIILDETVPIGVLSEEQLAHTKTTSTLDAVNMITEDYVSFETAKLLKEKGFDGVVKSYYSETGLEGYMLGMRTTSNSQLESYFYARPTLQMAMKWLRETHNIGIFPSLFAFCVGEGGAAKPTYGTKIISLKSCELLTDDTNPMPTYEEACEAAIKYCLENLI